MTLILGHRGAAGTYPENTLLSFVAAMEAGADGIELDVQMTKDGELVVIHDETVDRTTNGEGYVKDLDRGQIQKLDACLTYSEYSGKAYVPTLKEVLEWALQYPSILLNIELKNGIINYLEIEEKTIELISFHSLENNVIISSFNHYSLVRCKQLSNHIKTAILYMEGLYKPWEYAKRICAEGLHPHYYAAKPDIIRDSQASGVDVRPFTVNDPNLMEKMMNERVAAFITDYPEKAVKIRGGK